MIVTVARSDRDHALRHRERRAGEAEHLRGAAVLDLRADLLDDVVLRLEEAEPPAAVRDVVDVARASPARTRSPRRSASAGRSQRHRRSRSRRSDRRRRSPHRGPACVRRWIAPTSGFRASARKREMTTHASTCRAIQTTSSVIATRSTISRTRKMVRGRKSTTRSGAAVPSGVTDGASRCRRTLLRLRPCPSAQRP